MAGLLSVVKVFKLSIATQSRQVHEAQADSKQTDISIHNEIEHIVWPMMWAKWMCNNVLKSNFHWHYMLLWAAAVAHRKFKKMRRELALVDHHHIWIAAALSLPSRISNHSLLHIRCCCTLNLDRWALLRYRNAEHTQRVMSLKIIKIMLTWLRRNTPLVELRTWECENILNWITIFV